jgi:hypothetical protein
MSKVRKISQEKDITSWEKAKQGFLFWKQAQGVSERTLLDALPLRGIAFSPFVGRAACALKMSHTFMA